MMENRNALHPHYFVTGTDTDVGKTLIASALVAYFAKQGLRSVGMKPIAAGGEYVDGDWHNHDVAQLQAASNVDAPLDWMNPYRFEPPIAPHIAAAQSGVTIEIPKLKQCYQDLATIAEVVIVEGAGGFYVPINPTETLADLAVALQLPVILVVGMRLGCINHALLSVAAIASRGLPLAGWVANQLHPDMPMFAENLASLQQRISAPLLGVVPWQAAPDSVKTAEYFNL